MLTPIIAFSKDWHEDPTSNHHVLRELAKTRRVVWLNSLATRTPKLSSSRDLGKLRRKLVEYRRGAVNVEHDLWVATPLVLPIPQSAVARVLNRRILRGLVADVREQLGIDRFQLWSFLPNTAPYIGAFGESLAVYYCVDEWATFPGLDRVATERLEKQLLRRVDVTFATSLALAEAKRVYCRGTFRAPHGVDHALFARALDDSLALPDDLAAIPGPRIGFFGTLRDFIDVELLARIARARPRWQLVLIGQQLTDLEPLRGLANVHLLGQRPHDQLPAYCKGFDVGLIPYKLDAGARFINPLKLREYLSAGVPVVSAAMAEVEPYAHLCHLAETPAQTIAAIHVALSEGNPSQRRMRSAAMIEETWSARVAEIASIVDRVERSKHLSYPVPRFGAPILAHT
jgi:glycosyltransferase involved in cell wall biosynthesis